MGQRVCTHHAIRPMAAVPHAYEAPRTKLAAASRPYRRHLLLERLGTGGRTSMVCIWSPFRERTDSDCPTRGNDALEKAYKSVNLLCASDSPKKFLSTRFQDMGGQRVLVAAGTVRVAVFQPEIRTEGAEPPRSAVR